MRTREGMAVAKAKGRLRGKKPNLSAAQARHLVNLHRQELTLHPRSRSCSASHAPLSTAPSNEPLGPKQLRSNLTAETPLSLRRSEQPRGARSQSSREAEDKGPDDSPCDG
jgi:hypothetical protein